MKESRIESADSVVWTAIRLEREEKLQNARALAISSRRGLSSFSLAIQERERDSVNASVMKW